MATTKEELESEACVEKRERLFRRLQTTFDLIKNLPDKEDVFLSRADKAENDVILFEEIQDKIARLNLLIKTKVNVESVQDSYEDLHYEVIAKAKSILEDRKQSEPQPQAAHEVKSIRPKLPPIEIPKFKGDLEKFPAFKSLFDTLVHSSDLNSIQKFSFLKSYLEYPALSVIDKFDFVGENYEAAYTKLVERYTDKRLVGTHYLNKLLQFKPLQNASSTSLRQFIDVFCVQYESLKALNIPDLADFVIFNIAMKVLDSDIKRLFEEKHSQQDFPTFKDLESFVTEQHKIASIVQAPVTKSNVTSPQSNVNVSKFSKNSKSGLVTKSFMSNSDQSKVKCSDNSMSMSPLKCSLCQSEHKLYSCPKFNAMSISERFETAKSLKLCYACLGSHARSSCTSKLSCRKCKNKSHHTLLHRETKELSNVQNSVSYEPHSKSEPSGVQAESSTSALSCHVKPQPISQSTTSGLLGTVKCCVMSSSGDWITCRMIVDPASESSFITESLAQTLRLPRKRLSVDVVGVGSSTFSNNRGYVLCEISPLHNHEPKLSVEAIVLHSISSNMPKTILDSNIRMKFKNLQLADPDFDKPGPIDLLLGVQHYSEILSENFMHIKGEPAALNTIFGFLIFGKIPCLSNVQPTTSMFTTTSSDELLRRFWESEEVHLVVPPDKNDAECEKFFLETTTRDSQGRYQVSLPFKEGKVPENLGSTRATAHKRLLSLERRLSRNPDLKERYHANLQDYVTQDHMRPASFSSQYLLTHHAVVKESTTTQVRVVFNASEKSDTSRCLNEFLLPGPKLQADISQILLSFRMNPVALTADIKQMYRCIRINTSDTKFTHLLWRPNSALPVKEWELTTLPFGLTCSPYLAQRIIQQLVYDEGSQFPKASKALLTSMYVDNVVCSSSSEKSVIDLYNQLKHLLAKGGFTLRKFSSNSSKVLSHIPTDHHDTPVSFESSSCIKLLGFLWDPSSDAFCYKFSLESPVCTKRGVLSQVARIYDINGYLTPVTFWIKYFLQQLWIAGIDWDEVLPSNLKQSWLEFYTDLLAITEIRIPRYISYENVLSISLIGFCDASERGYAACIYLRVQSLVNEVKVHLLKAKSKVAPLKTVTIPRLELNGCVLLSKLIKSIKEFCETLPPYDLVCYTDSTTVLSWLHTPPHQLKTYVSNRVVQVLDVVPPSSWKHISGKLNVADVASRGIHPSQLVNHTEWWKGPEFLYLPISEWPNEEVVFLDPLPETKLNTTVLVVKNSDTSLIESLIESHSSLSKVQHILSYVMRFTSNLRHSKKDRKFGPLTFSEKSKALDLLVQWTQKNYYSDVMSKVKSGLPIKGSIQHLTPFISSDGLLKVGGRLTLAPLSSSSKNPCLIPKKSRLAELICKHYHSITLHGGPQLMQSLIQRKFWIPGIRYLLRSIVFKCLECYRFKAKPLEPLMSDVPSFRFKMTRAFVNSGVDLAGPFLVKEGKRRNARSHKCWVVLFICLTTRAVYIDLVSDLSTASFLSALDRFISRRGVPACLYSDQGTNFVGAARELKDIIDELRQNDEQIKSYCEERQIKWNFNPPSAPNFGGSWESAIKSMKHHLKRVVADRPLTFEEFSTLLAKIEAILNSRPLCPLSSNPSDGFDYLTPGHFLVGAPVVLSRPEGDFLSQPINFVNRWKLLSRSVQDIWRRWSQEYIHNLMQRPKWDKTTPSLTAGTMVLLMEKNLPPTSWSLGRILDVFPGSDGIVRVVKLKTSHGVFTRPVNKICVLPTAS